MNKVAESLIRDSYNENPGKMYFLKNVDITVNSRGFCRKWAFVDEPSLLTLHNLRMELIDELRVEHARQGVIPKPSTYVEANECMYNGIPFVDVIGGPDSGAFSVRCYAEGGPTSISLVFRV